MDINYTYTVVSVDQPSKTMNVLYRCNGVDDLTITVPFAEAHVPLDEHIDNYAPLEYWTIHFSETQSVEVGHTGVVSRSLFEGRVVMIYSYEILSIDDSGKSMLVVYRSEGYEDITTGVRVPFNDETLEQVIEMYAPVNNWLESKKEQTAPDVGASGAMQANLNIYQDQTEPEPVEQNETLNEDVIPVARIQDL